MRAAITHTLKRLALEYVKVTPAPNDGRGNIVELTATGRDAHAEAIGTLESDFVNGVAHLGALACWT